MSEYPPLDLDDSTQKILDKLPPKQKQCFILHYAYGYKYKEIAVKMKITPNTIDTYLRRARKSVSMTRKTP